MKCSLFVRQCGIKMKNEVEEDLIAEVQRPNFMVLKNNPCKRNNHQIDHSAMHSFRVMVLSLLSLYHIGVSIALFFC